MLRMAARNGAAGFQPVRSIAVPIASLFHLGEIFHNLVELSCQALRLRAMPIPRLLAFAKVVPGSLKLGRGGLLRIPVARVLQFFDIRERLSKIQSQSLAALAVPGPNQVRIRERPLAYEASAPHLYGEIAPRRLAFVDLPAGGS